MAERHQELATKRDLNELEKEVDAKVSANGNKIEENGKKVDANSAKIDENRKKIDHNTKKIEENGRKIDANSAALARISKQVVENGKQLAQLLVTTEEFKGYFHEIMSSLDDLTSGFAVMNDERAAMNARLDRIEKDVQELKAR
jgi:septation ring formation regulator EzrA